MSDKPTRITFKRSGGEWIVLRDSQRIGVIDGLSIGVNSKWQYYPDDPDDWGIYDSTLRSLKRRLCIKWPVDES